MDLFIGRHRGNYLIVFVIEKMNKYIKDICWVFLGFYLFAILFSVVDFGTMNLIDTQNSLGTFISSGGGIAAILAVIQIAHLRFPLVSNH